MSGIIPWLCRKPGGQPLCQLHGALQVHFPPVNLSNEPVHLDHAVSLLMRAMKDCVRPIRRISCPISGEKVIWKGLNKECACENAECIRDAANRSRIIGFRKTPPN